MCIRDRSWYIPGWLDRLLPNITIEPPHEGAPVSERGIEARPETAGPH